MTCVRDVPAESRWPGAGCNEDVALCFYCVLLLLLLFMYTESIYDMFAHVLCKPTWSVCSVAECILCVQFLPVVVVVIVVVPLQILL